MMGISFGVQRYVYQYLSLVILIYNTKLSLFYYKSDAKYYKYYSTIMQYLACVFLTFY